jgi:hypothetical protein
MDSVLIPPRFLLMPPFQRRESLQGLLSAERAAMMDGFNADKK